MKSWIILVSVRGLDPLWYGNIRAESRQLAKNEAVVFVARHLGDNAKIVRIAEGRVAIEFYGEQTKFED